MSWMDSWSRPSKQANFPPPIYLTAAGADIPYCHACGRVMSTRRSEVSTASASPVKYCSKRCRRTRPGTKDQQIEDAFAAMLDGDMKSYQEKYSIENFEGELSRTKEKPKKGKGDPRIVVWCSDVENLVFGSRFNPEKTAGRRKNRTPRGIPDAAEWKTVDMADEPMNIANEDQDPSVSDEDGDLGVDLALSHEEVDKDHISFGAGRRRPSQSKAEVNGSVGGEKGWAEKIEETEEMLQKRLEGQRRAEERELVRRAARRGVAFGFVVFPSHDSRTKGMHNAKAKKGVKGEKNKSRWEDGDVGQNTDTQVTRKKCEAVITKAAIVVEPSFAKGDWGIRWREDS